MRINFFPRRAFRIFLAATLALGMIVSAVGISMSHSGVNADAAGEVRQEVSASGHDHGHSHDDGKLEPQRSDHKHNHNHNPADHSHETPRLIDHPYLVHRDIYRIYFVLIPQVVKLGTSFRLERPPKSLSLI